MLFLCIKTFDEFNFSSPKYYDSIFPVMMETGKRPFASMPRTISEASRIYGRPACTFGPRFARLCVHSCAGGTSTDGRFLKMIRLFTLLLDAARSYFPLKSTASGVICKDISIQKLFVTQSLYDRTPGASPNAQKNDWSHIVFSISCDRDRSAPQQLFHLPTGYSL